MKHDPLAVKLLKDIPSTKSRKCSRRNCWPCERIAAALWLGWATAEAGTVLNNNSDGAGSLRQAILDASDGEMITFDPGVASPIVLTNGALYINKNLNIQGPGANILAVSG